MTTGHDDTGRRSGKADLLASLPEERAAGIDPAAFEEVRAAVLDIRERLTALEAAPTSERPEPVTRDALDAWSEDLLNRLGEAVPKETGSGRTAAAIADHSERTEEAVGRVENALKRNAERFSAEIKGMEEWLAEDRSTIRAATSGIESVTGRIESNLKDFRGTTGTNLRDLFRGLYSIDDKMRSLKFEWRLFLSPWLIFVFAAGMALESRIHLLYRLLWDS